MAAKRIAPRLLRLGVSVSLVAPAVARGAPEHRQLVVGASVEGSLAADEVQAFEVPLSAGQFVKVAIDQGGMDLAIAAVGPEGESLGDTDARWHGVEFVVLLAARPGPHRLELRSRERLTRSGRYRIRVVELRESSPGDERRLAAARSLTEGRALAGQGTKEALRAAIGTYEAALRLFENAGDASGAADALHGLAEARHRLDENRDALGLYGRALSLRERTGDVPGQAAALNGIGEAHTDLGEIEEALATYRRALDLWESAGDPRGAIEALSNIGHAQLSRADYDAAQASLERAIEMAGVSGDVAREAVVAMNMGGLHDQRGDKRQALGRYRHALTLARAAGDPHTAAVAHHNIGGVLRELGDGEQALEHLASALSSLEEAGDASGQAYALNLMGRVYDDLGDPMAAATHYERALALLRAVGDPRGAAMTLNNLGSTRDALGERERAVALLSEALETARRAQDPWGQAVALHNLSRIHCQRGEIQRAIERSEEALSLARSVEERPGEAFALSGLGFAYSKLGDPARAREHYQQALDRFVGLGDPHGEADTLLALARLDAEEGRLDLARGRAEKALDVVEAVRARLLRRDLRTSYFASVRDHYDFYVELLMRLHQAWPESGYDRQAFRASERARARVLLDTLRLARVELLRDADPRLAAKERELRERISTLDGSEGGELLPALLAEYEKLLASIGAANASSASLARPQPLAPGELLELLDDETLLLEYWLGERQSYVWAVTRSRIRSFPLPGREEIEAASRRLYDLASTRPRGGPEEEVEHGRREAARALSRAILSPVAASLTARRLVFVPDGALHLVPFAALPSPAGADQDEPLLAGHEIVSLPSASVLAALRRPRAGRTPPPKRVAVLADPVFDAEDSRVRPTYRRPHPASTADPVGGPAASALLRSGGEIGVTRAGTFPRLPFTRREAEAIAALAPAGSGFKALDFQASRSTALSPELTQYGIVHFATHGLLNTVHPELSGVVLSLVDEHGVPQNGFLRLHDIYALSLPAELVFLSACTTGLGREVRGEGVVGLTRGFMHAGASDVVVSLWAVDDEATSELVRRFYEELLRRRLRPPAALRAAQLALSKERRWRSPYFWAPFVLHGEYR
jgi:CHAT domain-containing protein/Tfp pilus assembly protein PilF